MNPNLYQAGIPPRQINTLNYIGTPLSTTPVVNVARAPTINDGQFPLFTLWRNSNASATFPDHEGDMWFFSYIDASFDPVHNIWVKVANGTNGGLLDIAVPLGSSPVYPSAAGQITYTSTGNTIAITGSTNAINFEVGTGFDDLHVAKLIVGDITKGANYATVTAALAAAVSGDVIYIQQGTYVEDITMKAGVCITSSNGVQSDYRFAQNFPVKLKGKVSASYSGTANIANICLETNGDSCVSVTGAADTRLILNDCFLSVVDNVAALNLQSSGGHDFVLAGCYGTINSATGFFFNSAMETTCTYCYLGNESGTTGTNLFTGGTAIWDYCIVIGKSTFSNAAVLDCDHCELSGTWTFNDTSYFDIDENSFPNGFTLSFHYNSSSTATMRNSTLTNMVTTGTGTFVSENNVYEAGTNSAVSVGAGTTCKVFGGVIDSSNVNTITGAGTLKYGGISFAGTSSGVSVTTMTGAFFPLSNGTSGQLLQSTGANTAPAYTTATYPTTAVANEIFYASATNVIGQITTANNGVLVTNGSGVPSIDTTDFQVLSTGVQMKGNNTNTAPPTGFIGESISSTGSGISLMSTVQINITSINLTAGIWDISAIGNITFSGAASGARFDITTTTGGTGTLGDTAFAIFSNFTAGNLCGTIPVVRAVLSGTTTYYLTTSGAFSGGTGTANGRISATRVG